MTTAARDLFPPPTLRGDTNLGPVGLHDRDSLMRRPPLLAALAFTGAITCRGFDPLDADGDLRVGTWGGNNAAAIVTDTLTHVHVGCTFGDIPGQITPDAAGQFSVDGSYI